MVTAETAVTAQTLVIAKTSKKSNSKNEYKVSVCGRPRELAQSRSMRWTARSSTKLANAVDCEKSVYAASVVNSENSHKVSVGQKILLSYASRSSRSG